MNFWKNKKILITGGTGFIGSHLADLLSETDAEVRVTTHKKNKNELKNNFKDYSNLDIIQTDLISLTNCLKVSKDIDIVFNLAAIVGGVQFNINHPAKILFTNNKITSNMLEAIKINNIERTVLVSSSCVYPSNLKEKISEEYGFVGEPDNTKYGYAWSKRFDEILAKAYAQEYSMKIGIARPFNVYGPRDNFNPAKSHVIPSIIQQINNNKKIKIFGNGKQERSFIFVKDAVKGLMKIAENYAKPDAINLGSNENVNMIDLVKKITSISGKELEIEMDLKLNSGSMKRICDTSKAEKLINFKAETNLNNGLKETIDWFKKNN